MKKTKDFMQPFKKMLVFLKEVALQAKKVNWPSMKEALRYTVIVLFVSLVMAIFLGGIDYGFTTFLNKIILR